MDDEALGSAKHISKWGLARRNSAMVGLSALRNLTKKQHYSKSALNEVVLSGVLLYKTMYAKDALSRMY